MIICDNEFFITDHNLDQKLSFTHLLNMCQSAMNPKGL
jgi:hypothetical protein